MSHSEKQTRTVSLTVKKRTKQKIKRIAPLQPPEAPKTIGFTAKTKLGGGEANDQPLPSQGRCSGTHGGYTTSGHAALPSLLRREPPAQVPTFSPR